MNATEYLYLVSENQWNIIYAMAILLPFYIFIAVKIKPHILEPMTYGLIGSYLAIMVPVFLYLSNQLSFINLTQICLSQILFYGAFLWKYLREKPRDINKFNKQNTFRKVPQRLFLIIFILYMVPLIIKYIYWGVPMFLESRLEITSYGGFITNIKRPLFVCGNALIFLSFVILKKQRFQILYQPI